MAVLIPDVSQLVAGVGHAGELETLQILKEGLPDTYRVFHGVQWTQGFTSTTKYGEIDFVIVDSGGQVLVIEQKNGPLVESDTGLVKEYFGKTKNVQEQLHRSIGAIRDKFDKQNQGVGLFINYLVYCPDHRLVNVNSAAIERKRVVDASRRKELCSQIQALLPDKPARHAIVRDRVLDFFSQTYQVVPDVGTFMDRQQQVFTRLTGGLTEFVMALSFKPFRLRVQGGAGSGKSQVARQYFARAVEQGGRPLYVCFNRPLRRRMAASLPEGGRVHTFHGLCNQFLKEQQGAPLDYSRMQEEPEFWTKIFDQVTVADIPDSWMFDHLIVDEGQDFEPQWYELLRLFLKDGASILWLEDADQNLYQKPPVELKGFVSLNVRDNYRTPASIARFIDEVHEPPLECRNPLPGLGADVFPYSKPAEQSKLLSGRLTKLVKLGFKPDEIVVLTCGSYKRSSLYELDEVGSFTLKKFTGEYYENGDQVYTEGQVLFDSVYRFKGGQAPVVILVDVDPSDRDVERGCPVIFCGMTRATVRLEMMVNAGNSHCGRYIEACE